MSLNGKAALNVEEVIENADASWNITEMWDALDRSFDHLVSIILYRNISSLPPDT